MTWSSPVSYPPLAKDKVDAGTDIASEGRAQIEAAVDRLDAVSGKVEEIINNGAPLVLGAAGQEMTQRFKLAGAATDPLHAPTLQQVEQIAQYSYIDLLDYSHAGPFTGVSVSYVNTISFIRSLRWPHPGPFYPVMPFTGTLKLSGVLVSSAFSGTVTGVTIDLRVDGAIVDTVTLAVGTAAFELEGPGAAGDAMSFDITAQGNGPAINASIDRMRFEAYL